jgi:hypothetical protein
MCWRSGNSSSRERVIPEIPHPRQFQQFCGEGRRTALPFAPHKGRKTIAMHADAHEIILILPDALR